MNNSKATRSLLLTILLAAFCLALTGELGAEDNWTLFQKACTTMEQADSAATGLDYDRALVLYQEALKVFESIRESAPNWNWNVVSYRIALSKRKIAAMERTLSERKPAPASDQNEPIRPKRSARSSSTTVAEANELRSALNEARKRLAVQAEELAQAKKAAEQTETLSRERIRLEKEIAVLRLRLDAAERQGGESPLLEEQRKLLEAEQKKSSSLQVRLTQATQRLAETEAKLQELESATRKIDGADKDLQRLSAALQSANEDLAALRDRNRNLEAEAKRSLEAAERKQAETERLLDERTRECERLLADLKKLRSGMSETDFDKTMLERFRKLQDENVALSKQVASLSNALSDKGMELGAAQDENLRNSNAMAGLAKRHDELTDSFAKLKAEQEILNKTAQSAQTELRKARSRISELESELGRFATKINEGAAMDSTRREVAERLNKDLVAARAELTQVKERREKALSDLAAVQAEMQKLTAESDAAKRIASEREEEIAKWKQEAERLNRRIAEIQKLPQEALKEKEHLQTKTETLSASLSEAEKRLEDMKKELDAARTKTASMETRIAELEKEKRQTAPSNAVVDAAEWKEKTDALSKELELVKIELANAQSDREKLIENATTDWKNAESLAKDNQDLKKQLAALEYRLTEQKNNAERMEQELNAANALLKEGAAAEFAEKQRAAEKEIANLKAQIARLSVPDDAMRNVNRLKQLNEIQKETIEKLNKEKTEALEQRLHLEKNLISTQAQLEKTKIELASNPELKRANLQLHAAQEQLEQVKQEKRKLEESLKDLNELYEEMKAGNQSLTATREELLTKLRRMDTELDLYRKNPNAYGSAELKKKDETIEVLLRERKSQQDEVLRLRTLLEDQKAETSGAKKEAAALRVVSQKAIEEADWLRSELDAYVKSDPNAKTLPPKTILPDEKQSGADSQSSAARKADATADTRVKQPMKKESSVSREGSTEKTFGEPRTADSTPLSSSATSYADSADELSPENLKKMNDELSEGSRLEAENNLNDALWLFLSAADIAPKRPEPQFALSKLHLKLKQPDKAQRAYEKALRFGGDRDISLERRIEEDLKNMPKPEF